ncbi:hypothetical protein DJ93_4741 [Bacillus clarus]|uniref:Uncharacterized protein n=1 Tax=Bacillus clarus TaxID=2338372 RepID=A0A090YLF7_9BACI|nr:hypothetical protein DJ93_4741 [Bacillus clarus]
MGKHTYKVVIVLHNLERKGIFTLMEGVAQGMWGMDIPVVIVVMEEIVLEAVERVMDLR